MRRAALIAVVFCLTLTGCNVDYLPYARDIETVELIRTMGLDVGGSEGQVLVTVSGGVQRAGDGGQGKKPALLSQEGKTIYEACNVIQTFSDDYIFYGHVSEWVLGEEVARQGLTNLMDFMERDVQMRLNTRVFVVKDGRAGDLLTLSATDTTAATDRLSAIEVGYQFMSVAYPYTVKEVLSQMEENGCGLVPAVVMEPKEEQGGAEQEKSSQEQPSQQEGQASGGEKISLYSVGYGYFKDNALIGFLDERQARGANLLLNQAENGTVQVELPDGGVASLRMVKSHCQWEAQVEFGQLTGLTATLEVEADIAEIRGESAPEDPRLMETLRQGLENALREETWEVLKLSQREEADFLHLRRTAAIDRPRYSTDIEEHWEEWFPELTLTVEVEGAVRRSYDISGPMKRTEAGEAV